MRLKQRSVPVGLHPNRGEGLLVTQRCKRNYLLHKQACSKQVSERARKTRKTGRLGTSDNLTTTPAANSGHTKCAINCSLNRSNQ